MDTIIWLIEQFFIYFGMFMFAALVGWYVRKRRARRQFTNERLTHRDQTFR